MNNLKDYLPKFYDGITEFEAITESEQELFELADGATNTIKNNQYVLTSDLQGVAQFENQLGIVANPSTEDIEFRKNRIINRFSTRPPFTFNYLKQKLNELIGANNYLAYVDSENYTLYIESSATNQMWAQEITVTLNAIKPANIVYINKPLIPNTIVISEQITYNQLVYNYKLGVSWALGKKQFASGESGGVIKLAEVASIQKEFLNGLGVGATNLIASVLINDEFTIDTFMTEEAVNGVVTLEYVVSEELGADAITNVKILDSSGNVLTNATVYVPLVSSAVLKHQITLKEGL